MDSPACVVHVKMKKIMEEAKKSDENFQRLYPALLSRSDGISPWKNLGKKLLKTRKEDNCQIFEGM